MIADSGLIRPAAFELPRSARSAGSVARCDCGDRRSSVRICISARKRATTRFSNRCGATTTRPTIAICSGACASACRTRPWAAISSSVFPARPTRSSKARWNFSRSLPLTYFHVFPYSSRRGTVAASLAGSAFRGTVKKTRSRRMRELGARKKSDFCAGFVGTNGRRVDRRESRARPDCQRGFSRNYLPVALPEPTAVELLNCGAARRLAQRSLWQAAG